LAETAHRVGSGALDARVGLDGSGDGFDRLSEEINAMLERIEALVGELRTVADGLAHDLRSPLTRLRSALERAVLEIDPNAVHAAIERAVNEADALLGMPLPAPWQCSRGSTQTRLGTPQRAQTENTVPVLFGASPSQTISVDAI
jgi:signal transduction histidine kinase